MSDWKEYKLGEVCSLITDGKHGDCQNETNSGYFFLSAKDVRDGKLIYDNARQIAKSDFEETHRRTDLAPGDILITNSGTIGRMAIATDISETKRTTFQKSVAILKPKKESVTSIFLYYMLLYNFRGLVELAGGTTQQNLLLGDLREFEITIPDFEDQKSIAAILSSLDDKIDLLHRQNKTLEALAEALFRQWFVEEGWETGTVEDEFDFTMGQSPPGSSYNEDGKGMVFFQGRTDFGFRFPEQRVYTTEPNRLAKKFDTLVSVRAPVGDMNMAIEECCLGRGVAAFRYKHNPLYQTYTYYKLRSLMAQIKQFEDSGTVFGSIGKDDFKILENGIPPEDLIKKFQAEASPLDKKIFQNTLQIKALTRLRDTLLPKLMSGEVRVKNSDHIVETGS